MATAKTTRRAEPSPGMRRLIGEGKALNAESLRLLDQPEPIARHDATFDDDTVNKIVEGIEKRQKLQSGHEIHVHVEKPDSDPPTSRGAALSAHVAGQRVSARGPIAWGLLVVILVLGGLWIGRATAPRHGAREVPASPK